MESLTQFSELTKIYSNCADFLFVYVQEAHPKGGWELNVSIIRVVKLNQQAFKALFVFSTI